MIARRAAATVSLLATGFLVGGCNSPGTGKSPPTASLTSSPSAGVAGPCVNHSVSPVTPTGPRSSDPVWTVAAGMNQPDDLLFRAGQIYVGELGAGKIHLLAPGLDAQTLPVTIPKVEGMVFVNGNLYVSDQQFDRVSIVQGGRVSTLLQLSPVSGQDGVDNINAIGQQLLVPDSPHGAVYWVNLSGQIVRRVGGFVRATGAWPLPDGSVLVADEFGNAAYRIAPDGTRATLVSGLPIVDDIAADPAGNVFVVTPVVGVGRLAKLSGGVAHDLVTGLQAPQGLVFDDAGNIFFSESDAGRVDLVIRSFKLEPVRGAVSNQPLCVDITRAPGYAGGITLIGGSAIQVVKQPGTASQGEVVPVGCSQSPCKLVATSGTLSDTIWIKASG